MGPNNSKAQMISRPDRGCRVNRGVMPELAWALDPASILVFTGPIQMRSNRSKRRLEDERRHREMSARRRVIILEPRLEMFIVASSSRHRHASTFSFAYSHRQSRSTMEQQPKNVSTKTCFSVSRPHVIPHPCFAFLYRHCNSMIQASFYEIYLNNYLNPRCRIATASRNRAQTQ